MKAVMKLVVLALMLTVSLTTAHAGPADDLSAQITRFERCSFCSKETDFYIFIVVTNKGKRYYDQTEWSCAYRNDKNELVGEDTFWVTTVLPNSETPKKHLSSSFERVHSAQCRLTYPPHKPSIE